MSEIKTRYPKDLGWRENLRVAVTEHYRTLRRGIILIMTTWGARRFLEEDQLFPAAVGGFGCMFLGLLLLIAYDGYNMRREKREKEDKKNVEKKNQ